MLYLVTAFFLALTPFLTLKGVGDGFRTPKEIAATIGLIAIVGVGLKYNRLKVENKWLLVFLLWCFITTIFNRYPIPLFADNIIIHMPAVLFAWKEMFLITLGIFAVYTLALHDFNQSETIGFKSCCLVLNGLSPQKLIKVISNVINGCVIAMCIYAVIQALGFDDFHVPVSQFGLRATNPFDWRFSFSHRIVGMIGNPSLFAVWVSICLPFCLYLRSKVGYIGFILGLVVLAMTWSATALISAFIGIMFYLLFMHRKLFIILLILVISLGCVSWKVDFTRQKLKEFINPTGRIEVHQEAWKAMDRRYLLGMGLGTFEYVIGLNVPIVKKLHNENWRELHDEYGQIWFSTGLIGLGLVMIFLMSLFRRFLKNITPESTVLISSLSGFMIVCLTLFPLRMQPTAYYSIVTVGLLMNVTRRRL